MKFDELIERWERDASGELEEERLAVRLPLETAAKLEALAEIYPLRTKEQLVTELLATALDQVVERLPYVKGERVIARDEEGDPVFEDIGHTPDYLEAVRRHMDRLRGAHDSAHD